MQAREDFKVAIRRLLGSARRPCGLAALDRAAVYAPEVLSDVSSLLVECLPLLAAKQQSVALEALARQK